ncbi:MAG: 30S ribosomal protein S1, partial [Bacillota bacterium]|nr:30S ribosomal protein S1 [Bacillota bacterium]
MSEDMNQVEVRNFEVGDKTTGQVTKVEEKQVIVNIQDSKLDGI